jgi:hypothetical protein
VASRGRTTHPRFGTYGLKSYLGGLPPLGIVCAIQDSSGGGTQPCPRCGPDTYSGPWSCSAAVGLVWPVLVLVDSLLVVFGRRPLLAV